MTRADLDRVPGDVRRMFDVVAKRYDMANSLISLGQDRRWRRHFVDAVAARPGERILDLAAGTGVSSQPLAESGAVVVPCDFSIGMLMTGKTARPGLSFVAGDGLMLPFADKTFDAVAIAFGLRNFVSTAAGLTEMRRVTRHGGRLVICEFSHPTMRPFRTLYTEYLMRALPRIARLSSSSPDAYAYLAESIRAWPPQAALAGLIATCGWADAQWRNLSGGIVTLHRATAS